MTRSRTKVSGIMISCMGMECCIMRCLVIWHNLLIIGRCIWLIICGLSIRAISIRMKKWDKVLCICPMVSAIEVVLVRICLMETGCMSVWMERSLKEIGY